MSVEGGVSVGASVGVSVSAAISVGPAVTLGSVFPERAGASFIQVANLDSGPIGGWGKGLASPEIVSFGSRATSSFAEVTNMFNKLPRTESPTFSLEVYKKLQKTLPSATTNQSVEDCNHLGINPHSKIAGFSASDYKPEPIQVPKAFSLAFEPEQANLESIRAQAQVSVLLAQAGSIEPKVSLPSQPEVVLAPSWDPIPVPKPEIFWPQRVPEVEIKARSRVATLPQPASFNLTEPAVASQPQLQTSSETRVSYQVVPQIQVEEEVEQVVQNQISVEEPVKEIQTSQGKKVEEVRLSHAQDEPVSRTREQAFIQAALRVEAALKESGQKGPIEGRKVVEFISSPQATIYRGRELNQLDPTGDIPDGGMVKNLEYVSSSTFTNVTEFREKLPGIIAKAPPVIEGEGKDVTNENVATSLKYIPDKIHPAQVVIKRVVEMEKRVRVIKKDQQPVQIVPIEEKVTQTNEGTIEDLGLEEVLNVASGG